MITIEDYMKLSKRRLAEMLVERDKIDSQRQAPLMPYPYPITYEGKPCYAPDGICTNPHRDCINCPKSWSDSSNLTTAGGFFDEKGTFITDGKERQPSFIE